ncbi:MAG: polymerase subunit gamma/tau [Flaviaesturariibacter sp.]|nr:polymerase subunit gamma/tau [Flaviaesturariibacter sp.]
MLFKDVIGQREVKQHLVEMVQHNRLSHALLFLGKEGSGALPLAMAFSQYVTLLPNLSRQNVAEASLFGEPVEIKLPATPDAADAWMEAQAAFSKAQGLVHPDIHYAYPVIPKKPGTPPLSVDYIAEWREFIQQLPYGNVYDWLQAIDAENKQGNITAQECNDIIRKLNLKSFESGYKTLVLWMPEYLGKEGNKLLKLIEEPPPDTLFILVAESESAILSTILSRCQLVRVPALDSSDMETALVQRAACTADQAKSLANIAAGNYREALHLLQHADEDFGSLLKDWLNATLRNQPIAQVKLIEEIARLGREKGKQFLRYFTHLIEQAVRLEVMGGEQKALLLNAMSVSEQDFTQRLNKAVSLEQKEAVATELDKAAYYIERNANAKILFHALTIRIFHIVKNNVVVVL